MQFMYKETKLRDCKSNSHTVFSHIIFFSDLQLCRDLRRQRLHE